LASLVYTRLGLTCLRLAWLALLGFAGLAWHVFFCLRLASLRLASLGWALLCLASVGLASFGFAWLRLAAETIAFSGCQNAVV